MNNIIAHLDRETGKKQKLKDHLLNTAIEGAKIGRIIELEKGCFLIALLHDMGKADKNFQRMIKENTNEHVNHSSAGSKWLIKNRKKVFDKYNLDKNDIELKENFMIFLEILGVVIQSHHGIFDLIKSGESIFLKRINYDKEDEKYEYEVTVNFLDTLSDDVKKIYEIDEINDLIYLAFCEFQKKYKKLLEAEKEYDNKKDEKDIKSYYRGFFVKLYLSILKTVDVKDTINAYEEIIKTKEKDELEEIKEKYIEKIEGLYLSFGEPKTQINKVRKKISERVLERGKIDSAGIYKMNLPTGAGKTYLSLRYGLHQLKDQGKERFFYITPFLSVLEQNASEIKTVLGNDSNILEHHSNIIENREKDKVDETKVEYKDSMMKEYLIDSWDSTVVLTTMVQFYQTLFKGKAANIRRFSSLINSVIIIDEIQSLPIKATYMSNLILNFLKNVMNCTIVLSTATQPKYDSEYNKFKILYGNYEEKNEEIVGLTEEENKVFERVKVSLLNEGDIVDLEGIKDFILEKNASSILAIFNTKKVVKDLYEKLEIESSRKIFYLSTNLCAAHRRDIISEIKLCLKNKENIVCISTQLIEAGVDVDFDCVLRSYAGIDSIVQSIGRCNREGKMKNKGEAYLINLDKKVEKLAKLEDIKSKRDITEEILLEKQITKEIPIFSYNSLFYEKYYAVDKQEEKKKYPLKNFSEIGEGITLFDLLTDNPNAKSQLKNNLRKQIGLFQSFKEAANKFSLIDQESQALIVYYKDSEEKINKLIEICNENERSFKKENLIKIKYLLKELQQYTVNVYSINNLRDNISFLLNGDIKILFKGNYDKNLGLTEEIKKNDIFFL